jgi:hypothetical protein
MNRDGHADQWILREDRALVRKIQLGVPMLPRSPQHAFTIAMLRSWLLECDSDHHGCNTGLNIIDRNPDILPTRVLDLGGTLSSAVKLVRPGELQFPDSHLKYMALSYTWGDESTNEPYVLTTDNRPQLEQGIPQSDLPRTFQDAITVTRSLGVRYLWIDALCIVQEGQERDFGTEAERMEIVFSNAYCVLAATRASGTSVGFLNARTPYSVVVVPQSNGGRVYVSEPIDDFQQDVIDGTLNTRGWVLQERALARRTIFFAERQVYWQCGAGVRCETLTKMAKYVDGTKQM